MVNQTKAKDAPGRNKAAPWIAALMLAAGLGGLVAAPPAEAAPVTPSFGPVIDDYQPYDGQDSCDPTAKPGVYDFQQLVLSTYPGTRSMGITRDCGIGGASEHKEGRAWDWGVNANIPSEKDAADDLLHWLLKPDQHGNPHANARRLGLMYVIWNQQIWKAYQNEKGWQPYNGPHAHTDHVHFSFSWAGALQRTTWWHPERTGANAEPPALGWSSWQSLGGSVTSAPDASSWGPGRLDVFVRGFDGKSLKHRYYVANNGWSTWQNLDAPCAVANPLDCGLTSAPAAVSWGWGRIDVFARGPDGDLWHRHYRANVGAWSDWESRGSPPGIDVPVLDPITYDNVLNEKGLNSGPDVASWDGGRLDVVVVGYDGALWRLAYAGGGWSEWERIGGRATSDPGVVSRASGVLDVFYRDRDDDLVQRTFQAGAWGQPTVWPTTMYSGPDAASWGSTRLDVFWRSNANELRHKTWTAGLWQNSVGLGGTLTSAPTAVSWDVNRIDVFARGANKDVVWRSYG